ncbi:MAG: hypothetical protein HY651_11835 [Acidobacteria bacterium]|nr:hypothetical protein [Acidobacteriota bacterium]
MNHLRILLSLLAVAAFSASAAWAEGVGNPRPGFPHDTIMIHVLADNGNTKGCAIDGGGHSLFVRYDRVTFEVLPANIYITMIDWVQVDNDGDKLFDEDPDDDINNDGDFDENGNPLIDEDGPEPGKNTYAIDCDARVDGEIRLQIRDANPGYRTISTQEWFIRAVGKPETNFAFTSNAEQVVCTLIDDPDETPNTGDEIVECSWSGNWINLLDVNLSDGGCVKQVKLGGKNPSSGGGKTPFCDITDGFLVDVDEDGDGIIDSLEPQFIFTVSCLDVEGTLADESLTCPLSRIIWDVDETETTSKAQAQIFVAHTGDASITGGKICKPNQPCNGD